MFVDVWIETFLAKQKIYFYLDDLIARLKTGRGFEQRNLQSPAKLNVTKTYLQKLLDTSRARYCTSSIKFPYQCKGYAESMTFKVILLKNITKKIKKVVGLKM